MTEHEEGLGRAQKLFGIERSEACINVYISTKHYFKNKYCLYQDFLFSYLSKIKQIN